MLYLATIYLSVLFIKDKKAKIKSIQNLNFEFLNHFISYQHYASIQRLSRKLSKSFKVSHKKLSKVFLKIKV